MKKNIVIFEDEKLEDAIRTEINNFRGDILKNEVDKITELYINNRNIKSISGIESLSNLNKLLLYENEISDIEPLRGLTKLRHLDIERNNIKDFNPIKNYVKSLDVFYYDNINRSLVDLDNSQNMSLGPIHDVIMGWFGSHFIGSEINVNIITEITNEHIQNRRTLEGFQAFKNLTRISLPGQMIEDLTPLKNLTKLRQIELQSNSISSIEPLKDLPNLEYIDLRGNNINDIELLKSFRSLPEVHVHHDSVTNDKALDEYYNKFNEMEKNNKETDKISYEKLNFKDKNFERIIRKSINKSEGDILKEDVRHIFSLNGEFAEIRDLSGIENLDNLTHLCLKDNKINSLEPLSELTKLVYLDLSYNKINSLDPLSELTDLISLNLSHNEIVGIEPLKDLTDLNLLGLSFNNVVNIEPLINMNSLNKLELEFNQIGDCELLEEYAKSVRVIYFDNY